MHFNSDSTITKYQKGHQKMKDTIRHYQFTDEMIKHGFSYEGSKALFDYFEQYEEDCDQEVEFDPIAFRCDFYRI